MCEEQGATPPPSKENLARTWWWLGDPDSRPYWYNQRKMQGKGGGSGVRRTEGSGITVPEPNLAFCDVSYTVPQGILSRKKGKVILDSIR